MPPNARQRPISPEEVKEWFGRSKSRLKQEQFADIAEFLNRISWPSKSLSEEEAQLSDTGGVDTDKFWDFNAAHAAVNTLRECLPLMLRFWKGLQWAPETRAGYDSIERLGRALEEAAPLIEHPFGVSMPRPAFPNFREWHAPAVAIAKRVRTELRRAGDPNPSMERNSVTVRLVHKSMERMGFKTFTDSAISQYLKKVEKLLVLISPD
jgi:hypothetical protein